MKKLIAFTATAQSGKDTATDYLVKHHGFTRVAFADTLKEMAYALNPIVITRSGYYGQPISSYGGGNLWCNEGDRLKTIVDVYGWEDAKRIKEVRELLQRLGTEAGREILGENIWVETAMKKAAKFDKVAISDCRFSNEVQAVRDAGGIVVKIERPGFEPINSHISDTGIKDLQADYLIRNTGTVEDLHRDIEELLQSIENGNLIDDELKISEVANA
jgi:hypothetical protein